MHMKKKQEYHFDDVISPDVGLNTKQVEERSKAGFNNGSSTHVEKSYLQIFVSNIFTFFSMMLFAIAIVFIIVRGYLISNGHPELAAAYFGISKFLYLIPLLLNIIISIVQEIRSKRTLEKLRIVQDAKYTVLRDGKEVKVFSKEIVIDDILLLNEGEQIPADGILLQGKSFADESLLTGESDHVEKGEGDSLFSGSFIITGACKMKVNKVGNDTYANQLQKKVKKMSKNKSDLMKNIYTLIHVISVLLVIIAIVIFFVMSYKIRTHGGDASLFISTSIQNFMQTNYPSIPLPSSITTYDPYSISIITTTMGAYLVGMIPTGLVLLTSLTLAISIVRLAKEKTLIQQLYSLVSLSGVDVICLDKTGTLTTGNMKLKKYQLKEGVDEKQFLSYMQILLGAMESQNATSKALKEAFGTAKGEIESYEAFSSKTKKSAVTLKDGTRIELGALEYVLQGPSCFKDIIEEVSLEGYRVLSVAINQQEWAILVIQDEIRTSAKETIQFFKDNHVDVKIISGDNPLTVSRIAKTCGVENSEKYISLANVPLEEIDSLIEEYTIFGRVSPEQKEKIVTCLQAKKHKVAMTGDGVNDILALRKADASISFQSGTEVAKSCSDVILLDDDFSHLKSVVSQGRRVVNNIRRTSILFLTKTFALFLLAIFTSFSQRGQSQFTLENIYLVQNTVITIAGFLLSLEGNPHPIKDSFASVVYPEVIASGTLVFLGAYLPFFFSVGSEPLISGDNARSLISLMTTMAGFVVLFFLCHPFNRYKRIVFLVTLGVTLLLSCLLPTVLIGGRSFSLVDIQKNGWDAEIVKNIFFIRENSVFSTFTFKEWMIFTFFLPFAILFYIGFRFVSKKGYSFVVSLLKKREKKKES